MTTPERIDQPIQASRRAFLQAAAVAAATKVGWAASADQRMTMIGLQIAPFNVLDEGVERCLDRAGELAAVNTLFMYSHTFYGIPYSRTANVLADDHGYQPRNDLDRNLWPVWVRHDDKNFSDTKLRFVKQPKDSVHFGRDIFDEIAEPARQRAIRVFARLLEPGRLEIQDRVPHFDSVTSVNVFGKLANEPCRNNPEYQAWCRALVTDLFLNYDIEGYQWGAERIGPLAGLLSNGSSPGCFCSHCIEQAKQDNVDADRAKQGYRNLYSLIRSVREGKPAPAEGIMSSLLGIMLEYPEVLAWEHQWRKAKERLAKQIYDAIKSVKPSAIVGRHIDSKGTTLNPITRAGTDYAAMSEYSDFIKPILYQDVMAPRIVDHFVKRWTSGTLAELSPETVLDFLKAFNGYKDEIPPLTQLNTKALSPEYVFLETQRLVKLTDGKAEIYPGIGLDVPHRVAGQFKRSPQNLELLKKTVHRSFDAGATGIVASREYDEMRLPTLKAFGDAVRQRVGAER